MRSPSRADLLLPGVSVRVAGCCSPGTLCAAGWPSVVRCVDMDASGRTPLAMLTRSARTNDRSDTLPLVQHCL